MQQLLKQTTLRVKELSYRYNIPVSTIWALTRQGEFPQPVRPTPRLTLWRVSDVDAWLERQSPRSGESLS